MQCKELEAVLESEGLSPLTPEANEHLASCVSCQDLLSDLSAVVIAAKNLPAEVTPPDRVWISIRAQLEAEGIIHDEAAVFAPAAATPAPWWSGIAEFFKPRVLVGASAALFLILGSIYMFEHRSTQLANKPSPTQIQATSQPSNVPAPKPVTSTPESLPSKSPQSVIVGQTHTAPPLKPSNRELKPSPSENNMYLAETSAALSQEETALPQRGVSNNAAVDASLRENLRTLNSFIAECKFRLKQNPQDQMTREYLNMAYQQKAELLTAMMDNGRSEH
ncbi:MAG TPA: hypothetical protein VMH89_09420 [Candidatus Acidoferrum sp.]|nr:hypothetical protein [Candidatus Acidoferrum sp.]